jgi:hypothetical protein
VRRLGGVDANPRPGRVRHQAALLKLFIAGVIGVFGEVLLELLLVAGVLQPLP